MGLRSPPKQLVKAMSGQIEVASAVGKGSIFSFELDFDILDDTLPLRRERCVLGIQNILVAMSPSVRRTATLTGIDCIGGQCQVVDDPAEASNVLLAERKNGDPADLVLVDDGAAAKVVSLFATANGMERVRIGIIRSLALVNAASTPEEQTFAGLVLNAPHTALTLTRGLP